MFSFLQKKRAASDPYLPVDKDVFKAYNKSRPGGPKDLICYVPFNSLTISWLGRIYACTYNRNILVGQYPKDTLHDVWFGEPIKKLQGYLAHNDLSYGCQHCKYFVEKQKFTGLKPQSFDKYDDYKQHTYPRVMEFEISTKCNLECIMCNGNTSSAIRQNRDKLPPLPMPYDDAFIEQLREFIPHLKEAKFFGGEPFLINTYFQIWDIMMEVNPAINIFAITNGTVLTEKVKDLLSRGNFELAISIDSIRKERFEYIRKNANYESVMSNLDYFNDYTKSRGRTMSLSFTTQLENWDELPEVIEFCNKKGMVFFNSFLTAPHDLSLIFLPSDKLGEIYDYLSKFTLPESNDLERYNKSCFNDYLKYILYYKEKNKNGIDHSEQKDNYSAGVVSEYFPYQDKYKTREDLYADIRAAKLVGISASAEEIIQRLDTVFDSLGSTDAEERLLSDIAKTSVQNTAKHISSHSQEALHQQVKEQYVH